MFAAPLFFKDSWDPTLSYGMMVLEFLPPGLVGLVLASLFARDLSMTASNSNTVSAVISRFILPVVFPSVKNFSSKKTLKLARLTTFCFTALTIVTALNASNFGGVFGLLISWFAALLGPISIPMILGLLPIFKRSNGRAAVVSIIGGLVTFILLKVFPSDSFAMEIGGPTLVSFLLFVILGFMNRNKVSADVMELHLNLDKNH